LSATAGVPSAVAVYCGFRPGGRPAFRAAAVEFGALLARQGVSLVYGGGGRGMMRAVADAVLDAGGTVIGVIPESLVAAEEAHTGLRPGTSGSRLEIVASMHERKARMLALADACAVLPGGMGTLDEMFEVLTWAQLGIHEKPCGMINVEGYFDALLRFLDEAVAQGFVSETDHARLRVASSPEALFALLS
jgi:uncharacterized protein (TIGR00730 family)